MRYLILVGLLISHDAWGRFHHCVSVRGREAQREYAQLVAERRFTELVKFADKYYKKGVLAFRMSPEEMALLKEFKIGPMKDRYMSADKPVKGRPLLDGSTEIGQEIRSLGEEIPVSELRGWVGPFHKHEYAYHITTVTQGEGTFFIFWNNHLVEIPAIVGTTVIIPRNAIHTFHTGPRSNVKLEDLFQSSKVFGVITLSSDPIPVDSDKFVTLIDEATYKIIETKRIPYHQLDVRKYVEE